MTPLRSPLYSTDGRRDADEPFLVTVLKVGSTIMVLCGISYMMFVMKAALGYSSSHLDEAVREYAVVKPEESRDVDEGKVTTLPIFELTNLSQTDPYGVMQTYLAKLLDEENAADVDSLKPFLDAADKLRTEFSAKYGGELPARAILERSLLVLETGNSTDVPARIGETAQRILRARNTTKTFRVGFAGQSATAGCGNFFQQSFPFVVENLLTEPFQHMGIKLEVRNAAMEDISAFPYGWCLENFLGNNLDMVSWDFGPSPAQSLEAYVRNVQVSNDFPLMIFRDSFSSIERKSLLQSYVDSGVLSDPVIIDLQPAILPYSNVKESHLPVGFQTWKEFGAPSGAPGKVRQNLSVKQHELFGWIISMHLLSAMELAAAELISRSEILKPHVHRQKGALPKPVLDTESSTASWSSLLQGLPTNHSNEKWTMNVIQCRTAFSPTLSGALEESIISGTAVDDTDLLHPKGAMFYNEGWVVDLETAERREKQLTKQWNNLGFKDYRRAYYGVLASGSLQLFLPVGLDNSENQGMQKRAREYLNHLVVCESNAQSGEEGCNLKKSVTFTVGGVNATTVDWIDTEVVSYRGKKLCVYIEVPSDALLSTASEMKSNVDRTKNETSNHVRRRNMESRRLTLMDTTWGLSLGVQVTSKRVTWNKGACSVAHVIWDSQLDVKEER